MKIQLKRSLVTEGDGSAKQPSAGQLEYGELAVNYSTGDPALFIKDENNTIVRLAGSGASGTFDGDYNSLTNTPTIGDATINITQDGGTLGTFTANQDGAAVDIDIPAGAVYTAEAGKGIAINASNEISIGDDWDNIPERA